MIGLLVAGAALPASAVAGTITVNENDDELTVDGDCSLREAVQAANEVGPADGIFDACTGGDVTTNVVDTINVPTSLSPYVLTRHLPDNSNDMGDLDIGSPLKIVGTGGGLAAIDADSSNPPLATDDRAIDILAGIPAAAGDGNPLEVTLENLTITGGSDVAGCGGGGIVANSDTHISNSAIVDNRAYGSGTSPCGPGIGTPNGGGIAAGATLLIDRVTVSGNHADGSGGGISVSRFASGNSTVANNSASGDGGGIMFQPPGDNTTVTQFLTVAGNTAGSGGGGIRVPDAGTMAPQILISLIGGNTAPSGPDCSGFVDLSLSTVVGNSTGCTYPGPVQPTVDPRIGALGFHGGPTQTVPLLEGSPAIDALPVAQCTPGLFTDQRGVSRPLGAACDAGAFEGFIPNSQPASPVIPGPTGQRAAALRKCKKKKNRKARKRCKKRALKLPV